VGGGYSNLLGREQIAHSPDQDLFGDRGFLPRGKYTLSGDTSWERAYSLRGKDALMNSGQESARRVFATGVSKPSREKKGTNCREPAEGNEEKKKKKNQ